MITKELQDKAQAVLEKTFEGEGYNIIQVNHVYGGKKDTIAIDKKIYTFYRKIRHNNIFWSFERYNG